MFCKRDTLKFHNVTNEIILLRKFYSGNRLLFKYFLLFAFAFNYNVIKEVVKVFTGNFFFFANRLSEIVRYEQTLKMALRVYQFLVLRQNLRSVTLRLDCKHCKENSSNQFKAKHFFIILLWVQLNHFRT